VDVLQQMTSPYTPQGAVFYAMIYLVAAWLAGRLVRRSMQRVLRHDPEGRIDRTAAALLVSFTRVSLFVVAVILYTYTVPALRFFGTALLAKVGIISIILGLAAQNTLGNLFAGASLFLHRPFRTGDLVQITAFDARETGTIEEMSLGYTTIRTADGRRIVVPNSVMAHETAVNLSQGEVMAVVCFGLDYESDLDKAREVITEAARSLPGVEEVVDCPVTELSEQGVMLTLRAWCRNASVANKVRLAVQEKGKKALDAAGIGLAAAATNVVVRAEPA